MAGRQLLSSLLLAYSTVSHGQTIDLIGVEYPPFTSAVVDDHGLSYVLLDVYIKRHQLELTVSAQIVPPARAQWLVTINGALAFIQLHPKPLRVF